MKLSEVVAAHSIRSILGWADRKRWGLCPLHDDHSPSFSVFDFQGREYWKCHSRCGSGDVIDLVGKMKIPGYDKSYEMRKEAAGLLEGNFTPSPPPPSLPIPDLPYWLVDDMLPPNERVIEYALSRGITMEQIKRFKIGTPKPWMKDPPYGLWDTDKWMAIPTFSEAKDPSVSAIKLRSVVKTDKVRFMSIKGSKRGLWGCRDVMWTEEPILLLKSEIPAIVARHLYMYTCSTTGESHKIDNFAHVFSFSRKVVVVGDNDSAGREYALAKAKVLKAILVYPDPQWKDFDQMYLEDPTRAEELVKEWIA